MASKYPGLLVSQGDKEQALYKGLLDMGANMTRGYTDKPTSFAQQVGQGGAAFGTGYQDRINQSKQDQMGDMKYKFQQAQMEQQKMKIEQEKRAQEKAAESQRLMNIYTNFDENDQGPFGAGGTKAQALQAAMPVKYAEAEINALYPTLGTSRPTAAIQNLRERQAIQNNPNLNAKQKKEQLDALNFFARPPQFLNTGTQHVQANPITPGAAPVPVADIKLSPKDTPKNIKEAAAARIEGDNLAKAKAALPGVEKDSAYLLSVLDKISGHPGMSQIVGVPEWGGITSKIPLVGAPVMGTDAADFQALLDQVSGSVFMQAYQGLKGGCLLYTSPSPRDS